MRELPRVHVETHYTCEGTLIVLIWIYGSDGAVQRRVYQLGTHGGVMIALLKRLNTSGCLPSLQLKFLSNLIVLIAAPATCFFLSIGRLTGALI